MSLYFYVKVLSENYPCITEEITNYVLWGIVNVLGGQTWTLTIDTASLKCSSKQVMCPNLFVGVAEFWCHFYVQLIPRLFLKKWLPSKLCYLQISQIAPPPMPTKPVSLYCAQISGLKWVFICIHSLKSTLPEKDLSSQGIKCFVLSDCPINIWCWLSR